MFKLKQDNDDEDDAETFSLMSSCSDSGRQVCLPSVSQCLEKLMKAAERDQDVLRVSHTDRTDIYN